MKPKMRRSLTYVLERFSPSDAKFFHQSEDAFARVGISVRQASESETPTCIVFKSSKKDLERHYPPHIANAQLSITDRGKTPIQVHLCAENWTRIPKHLGSEYTSLADYRVALISHEFAHVLGHDHVHCACVGCESDVRQQPSRSLKGCRPTTRVVFNPKSPPTDDNF